jgi:hypothetical protein
MKFRKNAIEDRKPCEDFRGTESLVTKKGGVESGK